MYLSQKNAAGNTRVAACLHASKDKVAFVNSG